MTKKVWTYCNVAKRQVPKFDGYAFSHVSTPGHPCYCDKLVRPKGDV